MRKIETFMDYAREYGCSLAQAIADRDEAWTVEECVEAFVAEAGRQPTLDEVKEMNPNPDSICLRERAAYHFEYGND